MKIIHLYGICLLILFAVVCPGDAEAQSDPRGAGGVVYGRSYVPSTNRRGRDRGRSRQTSSAISSSSSSSSTSVTGPDGVTQETVSYTSYGSPGSGAHNTSHTYTTVNSETDSTGQSSDTGSSSTSSVTSSSRRSSSRRGSSRSKSRSRSRGRGRKVEKAVEEEGEEETPSVVDKSYFNRHRGQTEDGQDYFRWNGHEYTGVRRPGSSISRRVKTTKTTTTTTTQTRPGSSLTTYTYTVPGSSNVTTYRNTTTYSSRVPGQSTSLESQRGSSSSHSSNTRYETSYNRRYDSRGGGSTSSSSSSTSGGISGGGGGGGSTRSSSSYTSGGIISGGGGGGSRQRGDVGFGESYHRNTEEEQHTLDYEEEDYDEEFARGPIISEVDSKHPFVVRGFGASSGYGQRSSHPCDQSSCYPATGNLLIGREKSLSAISTCGLYRRERYCIVSHLKDRKKCFWCDSRPRFDGSPQYSHKIDNIVYRFDRRTQRRSWWQSENGVEDSSIQLNLEAEFHFTHLIITFRTFRPSAMLIERSFDFGKTWKVYRYFAYDCNDAFPGVPQGPPTSINDVVCESRYSAVEPSTEGEVIFRVLPPNIEIENPYSDEVQNLLKITNLRVNFTKLHTLGDQLLDNRREIKEKYYYAIYDMVVRGSCSCYGHASRCLPLEGVEDRPDMVHGRCECTHNTKGLNCENCEDFYNDLPWRPAVGQESNACKRCNCNNHASFCHFDPQVYEDTGRISGGVCDDCSHNTQGRSCEECVPFYYQDPSRDIRDAEVCQPCNCDNRGSIDNAICDSRTDVASGLLAGRCHCKTYVDGLKCDRCRAGYWNFSAENPEGCQTCSCDLLGTVNNMGCNVQTGECSCKRFVTGRDCNQCLPQHYGLSEHPDGCQPCNCDKGGSLDNNCDVLNGQCKCRPHVSGRRCDVPEEGYYVATLNYLTYEAELARGSELYCEEASLYDARQSSGSNCQVVMREPYRDGRETTWTGLGFMRVFEGSYLEFEVENIETSMEYDLVLRYEPQFRGDWENIMVTVERPEPIDPTGPCGNSRPIDDQMIISLPDSRRQVTLFPPVCLESGKRYKIRVDFRRSNARTDSPSASILVDSIMLIPRAEKLPFYSGSFENDDLRYEYERYRCSESFYDGQGVATVPEVCRDNHLDSIGFYVYGQAFSCQCDGTGSYSSICSSLGGQCDCKPNVVGRRCDRCAPGTFGFGPEGCKACGCSPVGALDNFCDQQTGQCKCRPNTYGRQCDECQPGFWNFPNCQRCECNGHADTCDSYTGVCHECRDNTSGPNCALCIDGFYGDPRLDVGIACRRCPCPGTVDSGHSFADRCSLDPRTKDVVCECEVGYAGARCDVCADNYFGNPEISGGSCQSCNCNNNIDISRPGNCDKHTGECQQCLFNSFGFYCERCQPGFYGDALHQQCRECVCNILGSNQTIGVCDHETGQCPCLPNVLGLECDHCAPNHWKIASGMGCEACACDPVGSYSDQCNEQYRQGYGGHSNSFDGICECRPGFGGRQCNQCQTNFYGNPRIECLACNCNFEGSETLQCDHDTGRCKCREGIGGNKCDECARGFTGRAPYCQPCGECFDNWDLILKELKERTESLIHAAGEIKQTGATGAYSHEFESMEEKIDDVRDILLSANMTSDSLVSLEDVIAQLSANLSSAAADLQGLEQGVDNTTQRISLATNALADLRLQAEELRNQAGDQKEEATKLQEANVEGALNLTRHAGERSRAAQERVEFTRVIVSESERNRRRTENLLLHAGDRFNRTQDENEANLASLSELLDDMDDGMPDLNEQVCDRRGDPCDTYCGGAGCGKCGGLSCNDGLVNIAETALKFADDAEETLKKKEASADELLRGVSGAKRQSDIAFDLAKMAFSMTFEARNMTDSYKAAISRLIEEIQEYFSTPGAKPKEIRIIAEEVLGLDISLKPEQITDLAERITLTIESLTNIDAIIDATRNDLASAVELKERADQAKKKAEETLNVAERVVEALDEAGVAQDAAEEAVMKASNDIDITQTHLTQIASETSDAQVKANSSLKEVQRLEDRVEEVKLQYKINQRHLEDTTNVVSQAALKSQRAANDARQLEDKYLTVEESLVLKSKAAEDARRRAEDLKKRANKLASEAFSKLDTLNEIEEAFQSNEQILENYEEEIRRMEISMVEYHEYILKKTEFYATCHSGTR
ncbi:laminin subunit beta-1-like isoform X3 [Homarus americanus]|uniref:laminin subunit beta-1-like isoform X3 n=1 Tax=Homarus americanus TaxID=6706 RepID=UPI001C49554A|nr:laminin subunit beta-1-like isoform X3 [Homarus americanus]